jgi:predicted CoA-binding protein
MPHRNPSDQELKRLLSAASTIAIVGASSNPERPSNGIMWRLKSVGYRVIPVNPNEAEVLGERAYPTLLDVPEPIDIVDVFRRPEYTPAIADAAVKVGAKALWLQSGVTNEEAAARAEAGGLTVVMDACISVMHAMLQVPKKTARYEISFSSCVTSASS